ncbi:MAG: hypothetical protein FJZ63_02245, partial [Chlamydiae bacterium]|nr:hypothetical protein [Chlamydiota bacterium]
MTASVGLKTPIQATTTSVIRACPLFSPATAQQPVSLTAGRSATSEGTRSYSTIFRKKLPYYQNSSLPSKFVGVEALALKQEAHLKKLQSLAREGLWKHLQRHTEHADSGFDWWMFPVDLPSRMQGERYTVDRQAISLLQSNPTFMDNYRQGVLLIAESWGWDL